MGDHNLTTPARIAVVSNHLQDVTGEEPLDPQKATVLGPVAVIPLEYQNLKCVSIDVTLPPSDSSAAHRLIHQLIAELAAAGTDSVVAYRRQHRWVQTFVPGRLDGEHPSGPEPRLRDQGVYLVAGGTGGVGLALAEWLAKSVKIRDSSSPVARNSRRGIHGKPIYPIMTDRSPKYRSLG